MTVKPSCWEMLTIRRSGLGILPFIMPNRMATWCRARSSLSPAASGGDFDGNGAYECADVDALVAEIVAGTNSANFDLTGDGLVNQDDLTAWLAESGAAQLPSGNPYQPGDANLDGVVDVSDFNEWNRHKFTAAAAWCRGDFTADGVVDVPDFNVWNQNKFTVADQQVVPEPAGLSWVWGLLCSLMLQRVRSGRVRDRREGEGSGSRFRKTSEPTKKAPKSCDIGYKIVGYKILGRKIVGAKNPSQSCRLAKKNGEQKI